MNAIYDFEFVLNYSTFTTKQFECHTKDELFNTVLPNLFASIVRSITSGRKHSMNDNEY
jgi:hypothetical protein